MSRLTRTEHQNSFLRTAVGEDGQGDIEAEIEAKTWGDEKEVFRRPSDFELLKEKTKQLRNLDWIVLARRISCMQKLNYMYIVHCKSRQT